VAVAPPSSSAVERLNAGGSAPLLLLCDHASNAIPVAWGDLGLDAESRRAHVAWDIGAAEVTRGLSAALDAVALLSGYSRIFIDCNRALDDPASIALESDGIVVPGNQTLDEAECVRRADLAFHPYHAAVRAELQRLRGRGSNPAVIAVHSCTPVFQGVRRPWHVGVLWKADEPSARAMLAAFGEEAGIAIGDNQPYSAKEFAGHTITNVVEPTGLRHTIIEVRQDLIANAAGIETWVARIAAAIRTTFLV
jgi:predicted N-formylglutamate amidohydrolase